MAVGIMSTPSGSAPVLPNDSYDLVPNVACRLADI